MKIHVIDNTGLIAPFLLKTEADVAIFGDEIQALNAAEQQQPAVILLNYAQMGNQTPEYVDLLLSVSAYARIVIVGDNLPETVIFRCLLAGAKGYQSSRQLMDYLDKIIRVLVNGEAWVSRKLVARLLEAIRLPADFETLVAA